MGGKVLELESERLERIHKEELAKATAEAEIRGEARGEIKGEIKGKIKGEAKGEERLGTLINRLILDGRNTEVQLVSTDRETRQRLYKEYGI